MEPETTVKKDLAFGFYADLAIDKIKQAKVLYEGAIHNTSVAKIKKCQKHVLDSYVLFKEMGEMATQTKTNILNLRKQDLS